MKMRLSAIPFLMFSIIMLMIFIMVFHYTNSYSQCRIERDSVDYDNITKIFKYKNEPFTGIIYTKYPSGKTKFEWSVSNGYLDGLSIGWHESKISDSSFLEMYKYNYVKGKKIGDQYEYYNSDVELPFYSNNEIGDFKADYYGNLDGNYAIEWYQKSGCSLRTDSKTGRIITPSEEACPTGQLHVYYAKHPSPDHKLFTKCYGWYKCFWRSFRKDSQWWFD